jgi:hypothetical protein
MSRNIALIIALSLLLSLNLPTSASAMRTNTLTILPEDCRMLAGEEMILTLDGSIPPNAVIRWDVDKGGIVSTPPDLNAIFVAPLESEVVTISVSVYSSTLGSETPIIRQCIVTSTNSVPSGLAQAAEMLIAS